MSAFAYTEPAQLAALRAFIPTIGPNQELRNLGRTLLEAFEGISAKIADLSDANETIHTSLLARLTSVEASHAELRSQHDRLQQPLAALEGRLGPLEARLASLEAQVGPAPIPVPGVSVPDNIGARLTAVSDDLTRTKSDTVAALGQVVQHVLALGGDRSATASVAASVDARLSQLEAEVASGLSGPGPSAGPSTGPNKALSACEQIRELGKLGATGPHALPYAEWTALLVGHCEDLRPGAGQVLHAARKRGRSEITDLNMSDLCHGWSLDKLTKFSGELYSVLMSKTQGEPLKLVLALQAGGVLPGCRGLEAWRAIHYDAAPGTEERVELLRNAVVRGVESKDAAILKTALRRHKALIAEYDELSLIPLEDSLKAMGLKSILTEGLSSELLKMTEPPRAYKDLYNWVMAYLGRIVDKDKPSLSTSAAMDLGSVAPPSKAPVHPPGISTYSQSSDPWTGKGRDPWSSFKGPAPGQGLSSVSKAPPRDGCLLCGGPHWAKDCPNRRPGAGASANVSQGKGGGKPF